MPRFRVLASTAAVLALAAMPAIARASDKTIEVRDLCDPASFNAALGPDSCVRPAGDSGGSVVFDDLIARLMRKQSAGGWSFSRDQVTLKAGQSLTVTDTRGGEFHTFSEVSAFGPGCVPPLNALTFPGMDPTPPAICDDEAAIGAAGLVNGSPSLVISDLPAGVHRFQCMIHPWMQSTVTVRQ